MTEPLHATPVTTFDPKDIEENKLVAALSYVGILCLIPLLAKRESPYCQEHGKQGLVLLLVWIIGSFVFWIPLIGWMVGAVVFVAAVMAFLKCLEGKFWEIPVIGEWRHKFKI